MSGSPTVERLNPIRAPALTDTPPFPYESNRRKEIGPEIDAVVPPPTGIGFDPDQVDVRTADIHGTVYSMPDVC